MAFCTLEEMASRIGVSTTTVIRFAKMLGYGGYSDMQKDIQNNMQNKSALPGAAGREPASRYGKRAFAALLCPGYPEYTEKPWQPRRIRIWKPLFGSYQGARRIYIIGMRSSFAIAHYLTSRLGEIRSDVRLVQSTGHDLSEEIVGARKGDVCIAYMFPRYSKVVATSLAWMRNAGVKVVLITSLNTSAVKGYGDVILPCSISSVSYKNSFAAPLWPVQLSGLRLWRRQTGRKRKRFWSARSPY